MTGMVLGKSVYIGFYDSVIACKGASCWETGFGYIAIVYKAMAMKSQYSSWSSP